jgi:replication factor A1
VPSILIIMELEVLAQYGELEKIGQPEALDTKSEAQQPAAISGNNFYGAKLAPAAQPQQQQRTLPTHQSNPGTSSHPHLYPIDAPARAI